MTLAAVYLTIAHTAKAVVGSSDDSVQENTLNDDKFESWGIVDLFGHTRVAGMISEQTIGGETFIRVDVPDKESMHTRLFGKGAIYSMSLTDEAIAREMAVRSGVRPVSRYEVGNLIADQVPQTPKIEHQQEDDSWCGECRNEIDMCICD